MLKLTRRRMHRAGDVLLAAILCLSPWSARADEDKDEKPESNVDEKAESNVDEKAESNVDEKLTEAKLLVRGVPVEAASRPQKEVAKKQYILGVDLFGAGRFEEALEMFRMSYSKVASPNSQLMIARTLVKLERFADARRMLTDARSDAAQLAQGVSRYESTVVAIDKELVELDKNIVRLRPRLEGTLSINGETVELPGAGETMILKPGATTLRYELANGLFVEERLELEAGSEIELELRLPKPKAPRKPVPQKKEAPAPPRPPQASVRYQTLGYVGLGAAVVGGAAFATFGIMNRQIYADLKDRCQFSSCPESARADAERGRDYQTWANIGLSVAAVGFVSGVYFLLAPEEKRSQGRPGLKVGVNHLGYAGEF